MRCFLGYRGIYYLQDLYESRSLHRVLKKELQGLLKQWIQDSNFELKTPESMNSVGFHIWFPKFYFLSRTVRLVLD